MRLIITSSLLAAMATSPGVQAQSPPVTATPAPPPGTTLYESAFSDYKPYKEPAVMSWREANDQVRDTGGMAGHNMSAMGTKAGHGSAGQHAAGATPNATVTPSDPHAGHNMSMPMKSSPTGTGASDGTSKASAGSADPHAGHNMGTAAENKSMPAKATGTAKSKPMTGHGGSANPAKTRSKRAVLESKKEATDKQASSSSHTRTTPTKAPAADPHAGHDMGRAVPKQSAPPVAKPAAASKSESDGHEGHNMGPAPSDTDNTKKNKVQQ